MKLIFLTRVYEQENIKESNLTSRHIGTVVPRQKPSALGKLRLSPQYETMPI